jgi:hypothetical protein
MEHWMEHWFGTLVWNIGWNTGLELWFETTQCRVFLAQNLGTPAKHCCKISGKYTNIFVKSSFIFYFEHLFLAQIEK